MISFHDGRVAVALAPALVAFGFAATLVLDAGFAVAGFLTVAGFFVVTVFFTVAGFLALLDDAGLVADVGLAALAFGL